MNKLLLILSLSSLVFSSAASAVEYKTFFVGSGENSRQISLVSTSLIEIVSHGNEALNFRRDTITLEFKDGNSESLTVGLLDDAFVDAVGYKFTGLTEMKIGRDVNFVTLKITHASEINKAGPTTVLVLPKTRLEIIISLLNQALTPLIGRLSILRQLHLTPQSDYSV